MLTGFEIRADYSPTPSSEVTLTIKSPVIPPYFSHIAIVIKDKTLQSYNRITRHSLLYSTKATNQKTNKIYFIVPILVIIITSMFVMPQKVVGQELEQPQIAVLPAEFSFNFNSPSRSQSILRPTAIYYDRYFGEIFVADQGHNRVTIFDRNGHFKHEFTGEMYFSSPVDLAVDAEGYIWILGSTSQGRHIFKYDFDGLYLKTYKIPKMYANTSVSITSFDISEKGSLYLYDQVGARILVMDSLGQIESAFDVLTGLDQQLRREQVVGKIRVYGDRLLIVSGTIGSAYIYNLAGELKRKVGKKGGELGQLTFPVAAIMTGNGTVVILDKMSHNFVVFDSLSRPVAEIGGKGQSPGWFYQPTLLEVDDRGRVMIGQIFNSRVQACNLPELPVFDRISGQKQSSLDDQVESDLIGLLSPNTTAVSNLIKSANEATTHLSVFSTERIPRRYF